MKGILLTVFTLVFLLSSWSVEAQKLSKKDRKSLKKEIKQYKKSPEKWAKMKKRQKGQIKELSDEVILLKSQLNSVQSKLEKSESKNAELTAKLNVLETKYLNSINNAPNGQLPEGVVYQVQMGYYEYLDLSSFNNHMKTIKAEDVDGAKRYVIGYFENMQEALSFRKDIKSLGINDAFVTQYINGLRNMEFDAMKETGY